VIWWLTDRRKLEEVLELSAYAPKTLVELIKRYNQQGLEGLKDLRHSNPGAPALLSDAEMLLLAQNVRKDYQKERMWNGKKVVSWVKQVLGKEIQEQQAYEFLAQIAFSLQQPRPAHAKADQHQ